MHVVTYRPMFAAQAGYGRRLEKMGPLWWCFWGQHVTLMEPSFVAVSRRTMDGGLDWAEVRQNLEGGE